MSAYENYVVITQQAKQQERTPPTALISKRDSRRQTRRGRSIGTKMSTSRNFFLPGRGSKFSAIHNDKIVDDIRKKLLAQDRDYSNYLHEVTAKAFPREQGEINAFALRDDPLHVNDEERERVLEGALRACGLKR